MKTKVSISVDENLLKEVENRLNDSAFRNKSHFIEIAIEKYLKEGKDDA